MDGPHIKTCASWYICILIKYSTITIFDTHIFGKCTTLKPNNYLNFGQFLFKIIYTPIILKVELYNGQKINCPGVQTFNIFMVEQIMNAVDAKFIIHGYYSST